MARDRYCQGNKVRRQEKHVEDGSTWWLDLEG